MAMPVYRPTGSAPTGAESGRKAGRRPAVRGRTWPPFPSPAHRRRHHDHSIDKIPTDEIEATFEVAYCAWWSGAIIGEDNVLRRFSTPEHVATIEKFRRIDDQFQKLTTAYIGAKLAGQLPRSDSVTRKSSWGVLRHEIQKKRRHKPVRQHNG